MPPAEHQRLVGIYEAAPRLPGHIWLATSGTTGSLKLTALAKEAILASARAVNRHLEAGAADVWCSVLPRHHVGGLGIEARASLSGARVIALKWDPPSFAAVDFTLSALVPAQLRDLVNAKLRPQRSVRSVVIGGGPVPAPLYEAAVALGWPVLPSYGMTETASQVATATVHSPELKLLQHVSAKVEGDVLAFAGPSLLSGYATESGFFDPKVEGWFVSEDKGEIRGEIVVIHGRRGEFIKVGGESVDLMRLDAVLDAVRGSVDAAVVAVADRRLDHVIHLVTTGDAATVVAAFNARVFPFERIRAVHRVDRIPRTELGKLERRALVALVSVGDPPISVE